MRDWLVEKKRKFILVIPEIFVILWYRGSWHQTIRRRTKRERLKKKEGLWSVHIMIAGRTFKNSFSERKKEN